MIRTDNFPWLPAEATHRAIKLETLAFVASQRRGRAPGVDQYHASVTAHLAQAGKVFEVQFRAADYRRASGSAIGVSPDYRASASAAADDLAGKITVSVGLLYALEDLWQCVVSDSNTDLSLHGGVPAAAGNDVLRDVDEFHAHDRTRFFDYSCLHDIEADARRSASELIGHLGQDHVGVLAMALRASAWVTATSKMLSIDPHRVRFADFLADVSLTWILAHEDAHIYGGHTARFSKLGIAPSELSDADSEFFKLARERSRDRLDGYPYPLVRTLAELYADANACLRLVDTFLDINAFEAYPFLSRGVAALIEDTADQGLTLTANEARLIVVARICMSAAIGAVLLFHRHIEKKEIDSDEYPEIGVRLANIVITTAMRIDARLNTQFDPSREFFAWPTDQTKVLLRLGVSTDIEVITWNLLSSPELLKDPDLPREKSLRLTKHLAKIKETSRQLRLIFESFLYAEKLRQPMKLPMLAAFLAMAETTFAVTTLEAQYHAVFSTVFRSSQYTAFPELAHKLDDTYRRLERQSHELTLACTLADRLRIRRRSAKGDGD